MAIIYAYSGAVGANDGTTWADAYTSAQVGYDAWTVGDEVWVADDHLESGTNTEDIGAANSTIDDSIVVYRMNRTTNLYSPTNGTDTKQYNRTDGGADIKFSSGGDNFFGLMAGLFLSTEDNFDLTFDDQYLQLLDCHLQMTSSGARFFIGISGSGENHTVLNRCTIEFTHANGGTLRQNGSFVYYNNVTFKGFASSFGLFNVNSDDSTLSRIVGCDFTQIDMPILVEVNSGEKNVSNIWHFIACKFKVGQIIHDTDGFGSDGAFIFIHNTDSDGNTYISERYGFRGNIKPDLATYYLGGNRYFDVDGDKALSHRMTIAANTSLANGLASLELHGRFTTTGAKTLTIEILENFTVALNKRECWLEIQYLGQQNSTLWLNAEDRELSGLSFTTLSAGSGLNDWLLPTAGARSAKVSTTINVTKAGAYRAILHVAKYEAGKLVHYNPKITVT